MIEQLYKKIQQSIQFKILLIFSVSFLVVHFMTWILLSQLLFKTIEEEQQTYLRDYGEKITKDIRDIKDDYENLVIQLAYNHEIAGRVSKKYDNYMEIWESIRFIKNMMNPENLLVRQVQKLQVVHNGNLGTDGETFMALGPNDELPPNLKWYQLVEENREYLCVANEVKGVFNGVQAYIRVVVNPQKAFGTSMNTENGLWEFYLVDLGDRVIASSENQAVNRDMESYLGQTIDRTEDRIFDVKEKKYIAVQYPVSEQWRVLVTLPKEEYVNKINNAKIWALAIMLVYVVGMVFVLNLILKRMFIRINKIGKRIQDVKVDKLIDVNGCDEIAKLEAQYNLMLKNLDHTISELANVRNQKQLIEIKSLESYINPHFLYNTLGVIRWEALEQGSDKICTMVDKLSIFYRLSLNKGKGTLSVQNEIELAKAYLYIQQERCGNVVDVNIHVEENLLEVIIPKMILQPLLENIFLHGNIVEEGRRKINIIFKIVNEFIYIEVEDNGKGMDSETVERLNRRNCTFASKQGVGVSFLHEVLQIYYGGAGRLIVSSTEGKGTKVQIQLPLGKGADTI